MALISCVIPATIFEAQRNIDVVPHNRAKTKGLPVLIFSMQNQSSIECVHLEHFKRSSFEQQIYR